MSEQQNIQYQFVGGRAKYSRPNCAAIAQTVIASYKDLDRKNMIKADRDRLSAAEFMISEFNKKIRVRRDCFAERVTAMCSPLDAPVAAEWRCRLQARFAPDRFNP